MSAHLHALVAGAGPAGAATALLLARSGARVTLLERAPAGAPAGAALLLHPNGLAVLHALGFGSALTDAGHRIDTMRVLGSDGRPLSDAPVADHGHGLDHLLAIRRSTLYAMLEEATGAEPAIRTLRGAEVVGVGTGPELHVVTGGERHVLAGDLVVGADGVRSSVRSHGDFGGRRAASGLRYARALVALPSDGLEAAEHWTPLGLFGHSPIGDGTAYWYADVTHPRVADALADGDIERFRSLWRDALPAATELLDATAGVDDLLVNDVATVSVRRFVDGPRVLVGDAAHAMAPTLGQGANSALVDAAVLSIELQRAATLADGLAAYDARRRPAVQRVGRDSRRLARLSKGGSALRRSVRDWVVRRAARSAAAVERRAAAVQQEHPGRLYEELAGEIAVGGRGVGPAGTWSER